MMDLRKKYIFAVILVMLLISFAVSFVIKDGNSKSETNNEAQVISSDILGAAQVSTAAQENRVVQPEAETSVPANAQIEKWNRSPAQIAALTEWKEQRGWYDTSEATQDDYKTYSSDALKRFADEGDLRALHLLVRRSHGSEERKKLLVKAAMYGSTFALAGLNIEVLETSDVAANMSDEQKRAMMVEALSYVAVAKKRGELTYADSEKAETLEERYNVKLSDTDKQKIESRAEEIYSDLETQRIALGLGKFDNSIPPVVMSFYKFMGVTE
jgi:hypothetical protein